MFAEQFWPPFQKAEFIALSISASSILASSKKAAGNYPIVYLVRQWRKHIMFSYFLKQMFPKNVHLVYYEDLCKRPKEVYLETFSPIIPDS